MDVYAVWKRTEPAGTTGLWTNSSNRLTHKALFRQYGVSEPQRADHEELTTTFYDDYSWLASYGSPFTIGYTNTYDTFSDRYRMAIPCSNSNRHSCGMPTGSRVKVLGTSTYLYTVSFYDEKENDTGADHQHYRWNWYSNHTIHPGGTAINNCAKEYGISPWGGQTNGFSNNRLHMMNWGEWRKLKEANNTLVNGNTRAVTNHSAKWIWQIGAIEKEIP